MIWQGVKIILGYVFAFSQYLINQCFNIDLYHDRACFDFIEFMLISTSDIWIIRKFRNNQQNASSLFTISPEALISLIAPNVLKIIGRKTGKLL